MGVYWCAVDIDEKLRIHPPEGFGIKHPSFFHPDSPFPGMVMMLNSQGYNFVLIRDTGPEEDLYYREDFEDITENTYAEYQGYFMDYEDCTADDSVD